MARCGCSQGAAEGCLCGIASSDCLEVTGSGAVGDPFTIEPILDPDPENLIECTLNGFRVLLPTGLARTPIGDYKEAAGQGATASFVQYGGLSSTVDLPSGDWLIDVDAAVGFNAQQVPIKLVCRLMQGGVEVGQRGIMQGSGAGGNESGTVDIHYQTTVTAGTYTFAVQIARIEGASGGLAELGSLRVTALPA